MKIKEIIIIDEANEALEEGTQAAPYPCYNLEITTEDGRKFRLHSSLMEVKGGTTP